MDLSPPVCVGLDLAWGARNPTGGALLADGEIVALTGQLGDNDAILAWLEPHLRVSDSCIVAVDAPLFVRNAPRTRRTCDSEVSRAFGGYKASVHTISVGTPGFADGGRGAALVRALVAQGFNYGPPDVARAEGRYVFECYPHAAHIRLFDLSARLPYKRRRGRSITFIHEQIERYIALLATLEGAEPPMRGLAAWLHTSRASLRGRALKELEDGLDAITCAYVALWLWRYGPEGATIYGYPHADHIVVPIGRTSS